MLQLKVQTQIPRFQFPRIPQLEDYPSNYRTKIDYMDPNIQKLIEFDQLDSKTKNRLNAKKWREGRRDYLQILEETNFTLRSKFLNLMDQRTCLTSENKVLQEEIQLLKHILEKIQENKNQNNN